jgi:protein MpaA
VTIGHSVTGRPIEAYDVGGENASRAILVVGCIHGNEPAGIAIARRLVRSTPLRGIALWVIPDLNPDGVAADTRQNARGVDLNRNFAWHWRTLGTYGDLQFSGRAPLSEPEARAAQALILRIHPVISIWFHQPEGVVDQSGGDAAVEQRFASLTGLPLRMLTRYPGSAVNWENATLKGSTAFVVELPPGPLSKGAAARYAHAIRALATRPR